MKVSSGFGAPAQIEPHRLLAAALGLLGVFYFYSGLGLFTSLSAITPGQVTYWLVGAGLLVGVIHILASRSLKGVPLGLIAVAALYVVLIAANSAINGADPVLLRDRAAYSMALIACLLVFAAVRRFELIVGALQLVILVSCLLNIVDYYAPQILPMKMSAIPGRGAGLHLNPNVAAAHIALAVPIICAMTQRRTTLALYAATFLGVAFTLSRSGMLLWIAAVTLTELFVRNRTLAARRLVALCLSAIFLITLLVLAGSSMAQAIADLLGPSLPAAMRDRVFFDLYDYAAEQRRYGAVAAWRLFEQYPLAGAGIGFGGRWQFNEYSHNMILQTLAELGLLGGAWMCVFLAAMWRIRGPFAISLTLLWIVASLFSHNLFDNVAMAVIIAMYWTAAERSRLVYQSPRRRADRPAMLAA